MTRRNLSVGQKIIAVIIGALLTGFIWHVRGQHGYGAKWGMFCVGAVIVMYIYSLYANRRSMNYEMVPMAAAFAAVTAGGWGTLNSQIGGVLSAGAFYPDEAVIRFVEISPVSGIVIMVLLGFGWMPLFSIVLGSLFSHKKYAFKDYVIFVGVYYVTMLICSLTISHMALKLINPQAVECCADGIKAMGHDYSPMEAYIVKFGNAAWAKKIPYCRNYFTSINVISSAIGALVSSIVVGSVLKDKFNAIFSSVSNLFCGIGICVASVVLGASAESRTVFTGINVPFSIGSNAWEIWEYFTGFIYGLLLMIFIVCLPHKYTDSEADYKYVPKFENKKFSIFYNKIFTFLFMFGVILSRAVGSRILGRVTDDEAIEIIITVVLSVISFFVVKKIVDKNMIEKNLDTPENMGVKEFYTKALAIYIGIISVTYFFLGERSSKNILCIDYGRLFSSGGIRELWAEGALTDPALMLSTLAVMGVLYYVLCLKGLGRERKTS